MLHSLIREIADTDRAYDPFGAGMAALFAVCDVLYAADEYVPAEAGFRPGMGQPTGSVDPDDSSATTLLAGLCPEEFPGYWIDGYSPNLSVADLQYAARILSRYIDWITLAGRDY
jgi:hypothetical protein